MSSDNTTDTPEESATPEALETASVAPQENAPQEGAPENMTKGAEGEAESGASETTTKTETVATVEAKPAEGQTTGDKSEESQAPAKKPKKKSRKGSRNISQAAVYIKSTFNNTIVTFTDLKGEVISWSSSGQVGFKGSRKSTPSAAQMAAEQAANKAMEHGVTTIDIKVKGPGSGRETAVRTLQNMGLDVVGITDVTPFPHNGCRQPKKRRG